MLRTKLLSNRLVYSVPNKVTDMKIEVPTDDNNGEPKKFKPFNDTYAVCAFGLAIGMLYPNKAKIKKKLLIGAIMILVNCTELYWFTDYTIVCIKRRDIYNLMRCLSLVVIIALFFFKSFYVNYINAEYDDFLRRISNDLVKGNELEEDYQKIYEFYIRRAKIGQTVWIIIPVIFAVQFPLYAGIQNIVDTMTGADTQRHMQHEMEIRALKDVQYETPYYEMVFAYNFCQCFILMPTFVGFDGSFCIATSHLQMKLQLMVHKVNKAFTESKNCSELRARIKEAIQDHQDALSFYNHLDDIYSLWLLAVFLLTSFLISFNLYQVYLNGIDPKYMIFVISGVMHMYAPCYFAASLLEMSENLCFDLYATPWEQWSDPVATNLLIFMIAKAQQPMLLTGKGMVIFNMNLFVSIMQSSYSFFTLITS